MEAKQSQKPLLVVICGPTASGKTNVAIQLAKEYKTEILSADSRQCFREMEIGVARPNLEELQSVPHHFIASHSIFNSVDAAVFEQYGLKTLDSLFSKTKIAIVAGGTGLYIRALCNGLDSMPSISEEVREGVRNKFAEKGLLTLQKELTLLDPDFSSTGEMQNPQRVMRALEVFLETGRSIRHFQTQKATERPFRVLTIGMELPKEILNHRINQRMESMMADGLLEEVKRLQPFRHLNPLQTVGYSELFDYLEGKCNLDAAVELIKIHTRQYAKRQITWFKKTEGIHWIPPDQLSMMQRLIETMH